jgi:hypothetical protein
MRNFVQRWAAGFSARTLSETRLLAMAGPPARIGLATQVEPAASFSDGDSVQEFGQSAHRQYLSQFVGLLPLQACG